MNDQTNSHHAAAGNDHAAGSDPLGLGSLPPLAHPQGKPDRDDWPSIAAALTEQRSAGHRRRHWQVAGLAVAATLVVALTWQYLPQPQSTEPVPLAGIPQETAVPTAPVEAVDSLIALSQRMEGQLRALNQERAVVSGQEAAYQAELQDLIAQVDERISYAPRSAALWDQRLNLQLDLARLYEHGLRRDYGTVASL